MSTIDITQVAGLQAVNAEGNVIGTLSVDDLTNLVANNLVKSTQNQIAAARSVSTMSEASTLAASDDYENTLPIDANPASVRTLDSEGNPKQTGISAFAQVVGGLLGTQKFATSIGALWNFKEILDNDLNNALTTGLYVVGLGICTNTPTEDACYLEVVSNGTYAIQKLFALNSNSVWSRRILIYLGQYNEWSKIN